MNNTNTINIQKIITDSTLNMFSTMLSMNLETPNEPACVEHHEFQFMGLVDLDGELISGLIVIGLTEEFGRIITARMLDQSVSEIQSTQEIMDVSKEVCNIISGNLKSRLCDMGFSCRITPPSVIQSKDYNLNSDDWMYSVCHLFHFEEHQFYVRSFFKGSVESFS
ncbi:chemotaxis protein CheX [Legionella worsleiensis]|nr:chemotaxis protein CheX [Legionella worsleiensis]